MVGPMAKHPVLHSLYLFHMWHTQNTVYTVLTCYESCGWPLAGSSSFAIFPLHTLGRSRDNICLGLDTEQELNKHSATRWRKDLWQYFRWVIGAWTQCMKIGIWETHGARSRHITKGFLPIILSSCTAYWTKRFKGRETSPFSSDSG